MSVHRPFMPRPRHRQGGARIDDLLTLSVVAVAVIVAAYVYMPDFSRGVKTIAHEIGEWVQGH